MFTLHTPEAAAIAALEHRDQAYYWSRYFADILRKHGIVSVGAPSAGLCGFPIWCRGTPLPAEPAIGFFEAPDPSALDAGRPGTVRDDLGVWIEDAAGRRLGCLSYPRYLINLKRYGGGERIVGPVLDPKWRPRPVRWQPLTPAPGWHCLAYAVPIDPGPGDAPERLPALVTDGRRLVSPLPLLDLLVTDRSMPPMPERWAATLPPVDSERLERWLTERLAEHAVRQADGVVRVAPWPVPFRAAVSIRHDIDRPLAADQLDRVLGLYADEGLVATWYVQESFLRDPRRSRDTVAGLARLRAAGQAIGLHTAAQCAGDLADELAALDEQLGVKPDAVTAHGGEEGVGLFGAGQARMIHDAGLACFDQAQRPRTRTERVRLPEDGTAFLAPAAHLSLDISVRPGEHRLSALKRAVPALIAAGGHVRVLNHPDIHLDELEALLRGRDWTGVWRATTAEVVAWDRVTRFDAAVTPADGGLELRFGGRLPHPASVRWDQAAGTVSRLVPAGADRVGLPDARRVEPVWPGLAGAPAPTPSRPETWTPPEPLAVGPRALVVQIPRQIGREQRRYRALAGWTSADRVTFLALTGARLRTAPDPGVAHYLPTFPETRRFAAVAVGDGLRFGTGGSADALRWRIAALARPDGVLLLPAALDDDAVEGPAWRGLLGPPVWRAGGLAAFPAGRLGAPRPSVVHWYFERIPPHILAAACPEAERIEGPAADPAPWLFRPECRAALAGLTLFRALAATPAPTRSGLRFSRFTGFDYIFSGIAEKTPAVAAAIDHHLPDRTGVTCLDSGAGAGLVAAELVLTRPDRVGVACALDLVRADRLAPAIDLAVHYRDWLAGRFCYHTADLLTFPYQDGLFGERLDVSCFMGVLYCFTPEQRLAVLDRAWVGVAPGGLLVVNENIKSDHFKTNPSYDKMFTLDELEDLLHRYGTVTRFDGGPGGPLTRDQAGSRRLMRVVRKPTG